MEQEILWNLQEALKREEILWRSKSRVTWQTTADLNTKFFHLSTVVRRRRNCIEGIKSDDGRWLNTREAIEVLSRLLLRAEHQRHLSGIKLCRRAPPISHLLFAYDIMIFSKARLDDAAAIKDCLQLYSSWFGQLLSNNKSTVFFSRNTGQHQVSIVCQILEMTHSELKGKYLGLPICIPRSRKVAFKDVQERVLKKLESWKATCLSQAGRLTLLKSVAASMPSYAMSTFLLPKSWSCELDKHFKNFFWGFTGDKRHFTPMAWSTICRPKEVGGLGLRRMHDINRALITKLGWFVYSRPQTPWVQALTAKYLENTSLLACGKKPQSSWIWQGILECRDILSKGMIFTVKRGSQLNMWYEPWIPNMPFFLPQPRVPDLLLSSSDTKVGDLIDESANQWKMQELEHFFTPASVANILSIPLDTSLPTDTLVWKKENTGVFSVKSAYYTDQEARFQQSAGDLGFNWDKLWKIKIQARLNLLLWKFVSKALPVKSKLRFLSEQVTEEFFRCPLCNSEEETEAHLAFHCKYAKILWREARWPILTDSFRDLDIKISFSALLNPRTVLSLSTVDERAFILQTAIIVDIMWFARNQSVHSGIQHNPADIVLTMKRRFSEHCAAWSTHDQAEHLCWQPPRDGVLKLNCDAAVRGNMCFLATLARDQCGRFTCARSDYALTSNPLEAELRAIFLACQTAEAIQGQRVIIESDSLLSCKIVNEADFLVEGPLVAIANQLKEILRRHQDWCVQWAPRRQNIAAHLLADWVSKALVFDFLV